MLDTNEIELTEQAEAAERNAAKNGGPAIESKNAADLDTEKKGYMLKE